MSQYFKTDSELAGTPGVTPGPSVRGRQTPGGAWVSLILGLISLPLFSCPGPALAIVSLITGLVALLTIRRSPDRYRGTWLAGGGMIASVVSLMMFAFVMVRAVPVLKEARERMDQLPVSALERAEENIRIKRGDRVGFGNTEEARAMAESFAGQMKALRETGFSSGDKGGLSLSEGQFLTHCEIHEDTCAILVHVPQLRKFDDGAKIVLNDIAWIVAQNLLAGTSFPEGGELVVALKGIALYDDIRLGRHVKNPSEDERTPGLERRGLEELDLKRFFPEPPEDASPDPEIGGADSSLEESGEQVVPLDPSQPATQPTES